MGETLAPESLIARTFEGTRKMNARSPDLSPKLRAVLFLFSEQKTYGELLDRAGSLRSLLASQIQTLLEKGLVEVAGWDETRRPKPTAPAAAPDSAQLPDLPPVAAAKIQLLKRLEASGVRNARQFAAELLAARTLRELAERSRELAIRLQSAGSLEAGEDFWSHAKDVLLAWRDRGVQGAR